MIHSVFERDRSVETMSFIFCVYKKNEKQKTKQRRVGSYMFGGFIFPVYRNLLS